MSKKILLVRILLSAGYSCPPLGQCCVKLGTRAGARGDPPATSGSCRPRQRRSRLDGVGQIAPVNQIVAYGVSPVLAGLGNIRRVGELIRGWAPVAVA